MVPLSGKVPLRGKYSVCSYLSFVERTLPIFETVLGAPPPMHRLFAQFAGEAADNVRLPFLGGAIDRVARRATEIDANFAGFIHAAPANRGASVRYGRRADVARAKLESRPWCSLQPSSWLSGDDSFVPRGLIPMPKLC